MNVDQILDHSDYNLRSQSRLSARDDARARAWLERDDALYGVYLRLRNQRTAVRKEFYEAAFLVDRLDPELRRATRLWEMAAGHGMFGLFAALLHRPIREVVHLDKRQPPSYERILELAAIDYPFLKLRSRFREGEIGTGDAIPSDALVVGLHCCGSLTDLVAEEARRSGAKFAVVPCCERRALLSPAARASVRGEDIPRLVRERRIARWESWGYAIEERQMPDRVTASTHILIATPQLSPAVIAAGADQSKARTSSAKYVTERSAPARSRAAASLSP